MKTQKNSYTLLLQLSFVHTQVDTESKEHISSLGNAEL